MTTKKSANPQSKPSLKPVKRNTGDIQKNRKNLTEEQILAANKKQQKPNLKPSQLVEMEALWESGEFTLRELGEKFNRNPSAISKHMALNGVEQGVRSEEYAQKMREKIFEDIYGEVGQTAKRIKKTRENHLNFNQMFIKMGMDEVSQAKAKNLPMQAVYPNLKAIRELQALFEVVLASDLKLMNAEEFEKKYVDSEMPILSISELTSLDIEKMQMEQIELANINGEVSPYDFNEVVEEDDGE